MKYQSPLDFLPDNIDGYKKYEGIPGSSQNSGCRFYIREEINSAQAGMILIYIILMKIVVVGFILERKLTH